MVFCGDFRRVVFKYLGVLEPLWRQFPHFPPCGKNHTSPQFADVKKTELFSLVLSLSLSLCLIRFGDKPQPFTSQLSLYRRLYGNIIVGAATSLVSCDDSRRLSSFLVKIYDLVPTLVVRIVQIQRLDILLPC